MKEAPARTPAPPQRAADAARRPPVPVHRTPEPATTRDPTGQSLLDHLRGAPLTQRWQAATGDPPAALPGRAALERRFSSSLSRVRVHHGPGARSLLDHLGAVGAAAGNVILFRDARPDPATVAHEVAHVLQSSGDGPVGAPLPADHPAEREAEALARRPGPARVRVRLGRGALALRRSALLDRDFDTDFADVMREFGELIGGPESNGKADRPEPTSGAEKEPAPDAAADLPESEVPEPEVLEPEVEAPAVRPHMEMEAVPGAEPTGPTTAEAAGTEAASAPDRQAELREVMREAQQLWDEGAGTAGAYEVDLAPEAANAPGTLPFARGPPLEVPPIQERPAEAEVPALEEPDTALVDQARQNVQERLEGPPARAPPADSPTLDTGEREAAERDLSLDVETAASGTGPRTIDAPIVVRQGDADPGRADEALADFASQADAARETTRAAVAEDFGEERLAPQQDPTAGHDRGIEALDVPGVDVAAEVDRSRLALVATDANAGQVPIDQVVLVPDADLAALHQTVDAQSRTRDQIDDAIATGEQALDQSCHEAGGARDTLLEEARTGVGTQRDAWTAEADQLVDQRSSEAEELSRRALAHADQLAQDADARAERTVTDARAEAGQRWQETRRTAEAKARDGGEPGWLEQGIDWVRDRLTGFITACRQAIDALLDAAAALAHSIVDAASRAIAAALDALRAGLDLIAGNLPGELGELARASRDVIGGLLDQVQARLDAWAEALHRGIAEGIGTLRDALHATLDALKAGVDGVADTIGGLLDNGLMAFLRSRFPAFADLIDQGLQSPVRLAADQLGAWITSAMEATGLTELERMANQMQAERLCEVPTAQEQAEDCAAFQAQLDGAILVLDAMLASPTAQNFKGFLKGTQQERAEEQLGEVEEFLTFVQARAPPVLQWWQAVRPDVERALEWLGETAATIWGHVVVALGLDPALDPLQALQQKLNESWESVTAAVEPLVQTLRDAWTWLRDESVLAPVFDFFAGIRELWNKLKDLKQRATQGAMDWLASSADVLSSTIMPAVNAVLPAVSRMLHLAVDAVEWWSGMLIGLVDGMLAWKSGIALVDAVVSLLAALTAPIRLALKVFRGCLIATWRWLADDLRNLGRLVRDVADVAVGLSLALVTFPIGMAAFFAGNVWLRLLPACYKPAILNFLLDVAIRFVRFLPEPADVSFAILYQGLLGFLEGLRDAPGEQKVAAVNLLASLVAGNVEIAAGFALGIVEGIWAATVGTVLFLLHAVTWLITLPLRLAAWSAGIVSGVLTGGAADGGGTPPEAAPEAAPPGPQVPGPQESEEAGKEPAPTEALPGEPVDDRPPAPSTALSDLRESLGDIVAGGFTRQDVQQVLDAGRAVLRAAVGGLARQAATALLQALSAPTASATLFAVARTIGNLVGHVVVFVILAALTFGAFALAKGAIQGARVTARFPDAIRSLRRALEPLLNFARQFWTRLREVIAAVRPWIDNVLVWMRNLVRRYRRTIIRGLVRKLIGELGEFGDEDEEDPAHDRKIADGLAAIDREQQAYATDGRIARQDAEEVAGKVQLEHTVFTSITVVDGGSTWDYEYVGSRGRKKGLKQAMVWRLAPGGLVAHEGEPFLDDDGNPVLNRHGIPIHVHVQARHVNINPPEAADRVMREQGGIPMATGFYDAEHMEWAVTECLENRASEINERLTPGGEPAPNLSRLKLWHRMPGKLGYGYLLRWRQSAAGKGRDPRHREVELSLKRFLRGAVELVETELAGVTVRIRVSDSQRRLYMVETAYPSRSADEEPN